MGPGAVGLALGLADLLLECENLRQMREEEGEIPVLSRLPPHHFRLRHGSRAGLDEVCRNGGSMDVDPLHLTQVGTLPIVELISVFAGLGQQIAHVGRGEQFMGETLERCELVRTAVGSPFRHHGLSVPLQNTDRVLDRVDACKSFFQRAVDLHFGVNSVLGADPASFAGS